MSRVLIMLYSLAAYVAACASLAYLIGFTADFQLLPKTVDGPGSAPLAVGILVNLGLIALFGVQHTVMARPGFKAALTRLVPEPAERSTYLLATTLVVVILVSFWQPLPTQIWQVDNVALAGALFGLSMFGWLMVLFSTFLLNHFELFGLQQAWFNLVGKEAPPPRLREPLLYRWFRHPLYVGFFIALWATPDMTVGHLVLAAGLSVYTLIAIGYEERDLVRVFGDAYRDYQRRVGLFGPRRRPR